MAIPSDAQKLAEYAAKRFNDTFGFVYDPLDLANHLQEKYTPETYLEAINNREIFTQVAIDAGENIVGYSQAGPMGLPHDGAISGAFELYRLYVNDECKGSGLAKQLFDNVLARASEIGAPALYLGVWSQNARALAFYSRLGFEIVGKYLYQVGKTFDDERIMCLNLV